MERDGFVFYRSFAEAIEGLSDELRLKCFDALIAYGIHGTESDLEGIPNIIFTMAKPQIDANNKRFMDGKKGGRPKKTDGLENENQWFLENKPKEKEKEKEKDKVKEKEKEKEDINYQLIADMYNNTCVSFPKLTKLSDSRKKAIKARLNKYSIEDIQKAFDMAEESDFLKGSNNRNWSANFDWLMNDSNLAKVLDGNYKNKTSKIEMDGKLRQFIDKNQVVDFGM